jgi:hypothetical protein
MDNLTVCSRCGSDACYVDQVSKDIKNYMCYGCGFITNSLMKEGSEFLTEQKDSLPELYRALLTQDEEGKIWMPNTINQPEKGMVFAYGPSKDNWRWAAVKAVKRTKEDLKKNPKNKSQYKMDMTNIVYFEEKDFMEALDHIGIFAK